MPGIDMVVELIGGADGVARDLAEAALQERQALRHCQQGADRGAWRRAGARSPKAKRSQLQFEAAVAGGIPVIKTLREGLAGNRISMLRGILNGTCNYILTRMGEARAEFRGSCCAKRRQKVMPKPIRPPISTAMIPPTSSLCSPRLPSASRPISPPSRSKASAASSARSQTRRRARLPHQACSAWRVRAKSGIEQQVGPCLVPEDSPLAGVDGAMNAVLLRGDVRRRHDAGRAGAGARADRQRRRRRYHRCRARPCACPPSAFRPRT